MERWTSCIKQNSHSLEEHIWCCALQENAGGTAEVSLPMGSYQHWCHRAQSPPVIVFMPADSGHNPACLTSWGRQQWPRSRSACSELLAWQSLIRFDGIRWKQRRGKQGQEATPCLGLLGWSCNPSGCFQAGGS